MRKSLRTIRRHVYIIAGAVLVATTTLPALTQTASAAGLVTSRSIELSSSVASATNTTYAVQFNVATTASVQAIILDFCDNDPLVADTTCTAPGGFSITASPAVNNQSGAGSCNLSTFTTAAQLNSNRTLELSAASAVSLTSGGTCTFNITTVTNPNTANHSFYARVYTFDTTAHASAYSPGVLTNVIDDGGFALSTASQISITATVQETLTFCVSGAAVGNGCSGPAPSTPSLVLGHGTPAVLTNTQIDQAPAFVQTTTNANSGVVVRMKASNSCSNGGLSSSGGATCQIPGIGSSAVVFPTLPDTTSADYGMCVNSATATIATNYKDTVNSCPSGATASTTSKFGMNGTNLTSTFGDQIYSYAGPVTNDNVTLEFAGVVVPTTQAGIYTGNEGLIATGTF